MLAASSAGFEAYHTGDQALDDDPYRKRGRPYLEVGLLGELTFGDVSVFVNAGVRMRFGGR